MNIEGLSELYEQVQDHGDIEEIARATHLEADAMLDVLARSIEVKYVIEKDYAANTVHCAIITTSKISGLKTVQRVPLLTDLFD